MVQNICRVLCTEVNSQNIEFNRDNKLQRADYPGLKRLFHGLLELLKIS